VRRNQRLGKVRFWAHIKKAGSIKSSKKGLFLLIGSPRWLGPAYQL